MARLESVQDLEILRDEIRSKRGSEVKEVSICAGTGCQSLGARKVIGAFQREIAKKGLDIKIKETGCSGFCERGLVW